ncbi:hypothetical protein BXZ70DRAFT_801374 [Cristinia sonorae]|uniref:Uncharacterized protein n=1 Tax=Cristinia sonorae TaxID=1940300 RepID=A0A8K0XRL7_9AGAR|nr:hypothetical protein BXZ70DRAFT_801374 [Cristinia sonorae]
MTRSVPIFETLLATRPDRKWYDDFRAKLKKYEQSCSRDQIPSDRLEFADQQVLFVFLARLDSIHHSKNTPMMFLTEAATSSFSDKNIHSPFDFFRDMARRQASVPVGLSAGFGYLFVSQIISCDGNKSLVESDSEDARNKTWWENHAKAVFRVARSASEFPGRVEQQFAIVYATMFGDTQSELFVTAPAMSAFNRRNEDAKRFFDAIFL